MSLRLDSTEWISGALLIGETGLGVLGSAIPSGGTDGASYLYNDLTLPADAGKEIAGRIITPPSGGVFFAYEDGSFTFTGADGSYSFTYQLYVDGVATGPVTAASIEVGVAVGPTYTLTANPASITMTGQSAALSANRVLSANPASLDFTGQSAGLYARRTLQADPATITLTGQAVELTYSAAPGATYTLTVTAASLAFTGQSASLLAARRLSAEPAAFAFDGQQGSLIRAYSLSAQGTSFALTGQDVALLATRVLSAQGTGFAFTGHSVGLSYSGYVEPPTYTAGAVMRPVRYQISSRPSRLQTGTRASR